MQLMVSEMLRAWGWEITGEDRAVFVGVQAFLPATPGDVTSL